MHCMWQLNCIYVYSTVAEHCVVHGYYQLHWVQFPAIVSFVHVFPFFMMSENDYLWFNYVFKIQNREHTVHVHGYGIR